MAGKRYYPNKGKGGWKGREQRSRPVSLHQDLDRLEEERARLAVRKAQLLEDAVKNGGLGDVLTAQQFLATSNSIAKELQRKQKSYLFDPLQTNDQMGYKEKPVVSHQILRQMSSVPLIKAIVGTRVEQVASFAKPWETTDKVGWTIIKKRRLFATKEDSELTDQEKFEIEGLVEFMMRCGVQKEMWLKDTFDTFLRKIVPDALVLDQMTFEVQQTRNRRPYQFMATDGATYRLARSFNNENPEDNQVEVAGYYPSYVQLYQGSVCAEFYPWELCFGMRNLSTAIEANGYSTSELENMIRLVTWIVNTDSYNGKFFSNGASPKGFISVKGNVTQDRLDEFRIAFRSQTAGVENAWRTPILQTDGEVDWVNLQMTNNDMQWGTWQEYLIKLSCALYKIDPTEIGFTINNGNVVYEGKENYRLQYSRVKGLFPLLKFIQAKINQYIIEPLTGGKYEFQFGGGINDEDDKDVGLDNDIKKLSNFMGLKEVRRLYNLPDEVEEGDMILNPIWFQSQQAKMMGNPMSNQAAALMGGENPFQDGGSGQGQNENPFLLGQGQQEQDMGGGEDNPFMKGLNDFMDKMIHQTK